MMRVGSRRRHDAGAGPSLLGAMDRWVEPSRLARCAPFRGDAIAELARLGRDRQVFKQPDRVSGEQVRCCREQLLVLDDVGMTSGAGSERLLPDPERAADITEGELCLVAHPVGKAAIAPAGHALGATAGFPPFP